jgi:hypothetical protein
VYVKIPPDLVISPEKAKKVVQDIAKVRLENSLVQAIALLRQTKRDDVVCTKCYLPASYHSFLSENCAHC